MLERERPDLVSVCLPNEGHFEPTLAGHPGRVPAVRREAVRLRPRRGRRPARARRRPARCSSPSTSTTATPRPVAMAADAVRAGDLGELVFATWRFGGEAGTSSHPHANLIETQCHGLDMLEHLCGPIDSVTAQMTDKTGRGYSTLVGRPALRQRSGRQPGRLLRLLLRLSGDPPARAERHQRPDPGRGHRPALHLHRGRRARSAASGRPATSTTSTASSTGPSTSTSTSCSQPSAKDQAPPVHARAGRRALALAHAIIDSFESGTRIDVPPDDDTARGSASYEVSSGPRPPQRLRK